MVEETGKRKDGPGRRENLEEGTRDRMYNYKERTRGKRKMRCVKRTGGNE